MFMQCFISGDTWFLTGPFSGVCADRNGLSYPPKKNQVQLGTLFLISYNAKCSPVLIPDWDSQARCLERTNNNSARTRLHQLAAKARPSWVAGCCPLQAAVTNRRSPPGLGARRHRSSPGTAGFITPPHHFHRKVVLGHWRLNSLSRANTLLVVE